MSETSASRLKVSREGVVLIKSFEGFRPRAVRGDDGRWVIGYGHTASAREGLTVSEPDAELLLQYDLMPVVQALNEQVAAPLNQHQFDALASFAVSIGVDRFLSSDVLEQLNAGRSGQAADALTGWRASTPETAQRRRAAERALFMADPSGPVMLADLLSAPLPPPPAPDLPEPEPAPQPAPRPVAEGFSPAASRYAPYGAMMVGPIPGWPPARAAAPSPRPPEPEPEPIEDAPRIEDTPPALDAVTPAVSMEPDPPAAPEETATEPDPAPFDPAWDATAEAAPEPAVEIEPLALSPLSPPPVFTASASFPSDSPVVTPDFGSPFPATFDAAPSTPAFEGSPFPALDQPLVLTPATEADFADADRPVWAAEDRQPAPAADAPLFGEEQQSILRHEADPVPAVSTGGRFDWSETGAFLIMGGVGLAACAASAAAFRLSATQPSPMGETSVIAWALAIIGVICVGVSSWNLYVRWGSRD